MSTAERQEWDPRGIRAAIKARTRDLRDGRMLEDVIEDLCADGTIPEWFVANLARRALHDAVRKIFASDVDERGRRNVEFFSAANETGTMVQLGIHRDWTELAHHRAIQRARHRGVFADLRRAQDNLDVCRENHGVDLLDEAEFAPWRAVYAAASGIGDEGLDDAGYVSDPDGPTG